MGFEMCECGMVGKRTTAGMAEQNGHDSSGRENTLTGPGPAHIARDACGGIENLSLDDAAEESLEDIYNFVSP
jgi:hypothetical protein